MEISDRGLAFIAGWEGGQSADGLYRAYWDPFGNVWTIGIGETEGVHQGMVWTQAQAFADLRRRMHSEYEPALTALKVPLNQNQWDALCSFIWNVGPGSMQWDIGRALRARQYSLAADLLLEYDRAGGQVLQGLVNRRRAERVLFLTPADPRDRFDRTIRQLPGGRHASEHGTVIEYDHKRKHPSLHRRRLRRLRNNAGFLAQRIEEIQHLDPRAAHRFERPWRRRQLEGREHGRRYV